MAASRVPALSKYERQMRDTAESSLDELRHKLEISPKKTPNRRNSRLSSQQSSPYSVSVERLKEHIHKYDAIKRRKPNESTLTRFDVPEPDELAQLLNDQHTLLQHLEGQVDYYKEALSKLKQKADIVIEENSRLHEQIIDGIQNEFSNLHGSHLNSETHSERPVIDCGVQTEASKSSNAAEYFGQAKDSQQESEGGHSTERSHGKRRLSKAETENAKLLKDHADVPMIQKSPERETKRLDEMKEERAKHLESLLQAARDESKEKDALIKKLESDKSKLNRGDALDYQEDGNICIKCAHHEGVIGVRKFGVNERVIKRIERENLELIEAASKQRKTIEDLRRRETEAFLRVKRSCEIAEDVQLEKQELNISLQKANLEIARLKEEHANQMKKFNESMRKEKLKLKMENEEKFSRCEKMVEEANETLSKTEAQLERAKREKLALKATLEKIEAGIVAHDKDMEKKLDETGSALREANKENVLLSQENQRLSNEKKNFEKVQGQKLDWTSSELNALKKRLLETEQRLESSKVECLGLTEELQAAKKQLQLEVNARNRERSACKNELEQMRTSSKLQQQQLEARWREAEAKYEATKTELGTLVESQMQVSKGFREECRRLAEKLEKTEVENKAAQQRVMEENSQLKKDLRNTSYEKHDLTTKISRITEQNEAFEKAVGVADVQIQKYAEKAILLMNKYNYVLRERQLLREEVSFLKSQLPAFRHTDRISISDLDSTDKATG